MKVEVCDFEIQISIDEGAQSYIQGELFFHLSRTKKFAEERACFYAAQLCCALLFLHRNGVLWLCNPTNILLDSNGNIKLSDYCIINRYSDLTAEDLEYFPPEV